MFSPSKVLVIDHNHDNGALLVRSLSRKFPSAVVQLCKDSDVALKVVATETVDAVVIHRTEQDAVSLVRAVRSALPNVIIIAVSGVDRSEQVLKAGADGFMNYEQWLMIGTVVANAAEKKKPLTNGTK